MAPGYYLAAAILTGALQRQSLTVTYSKRRQGVNFRGPRPTTECPECLLATVLPVAEAASATSCKSLHDHRTCLQQTKDCQGFGVCV